MTCKYHEVFVKTCSMKQCPFPPGGAVNDSIQNAWCGFFKSSAGNSPRKCLPALGSATHPSYWPWALSTKRDRQTEAKARGSIWVHCCQENGCSWWKCLAYGSSKVRRASHLLEEGGEETPRQEGACPAVVATICKGAMPVQTTPPPPLYRLTQLRTGDGEKPLQ